MSLFFTKQTQDTLVSLGSERLALVFFQKNGQISDVLDYIYMIFLNQFFKYGENELAKSPVYKVLKIIFQQSRIRVYVEN